MTMKKSIGIMAGLLGGLGMAAPQATRPAPPAKAPAPAKAPVADPTKWVEIETLSFDHHLPSNWVRVETKRRDFTRPWTGVWRYGSPTMRRQLAIRVSSK